MTLPIQTNPAPVNLAAKPARIATFEYLGVAGWLIRHGKDAILGAPFFSNPGLRQLLLSKHVEPDAPMVAKHMEKAAGRDDVRAVIAGHAHYDHIMDLPEVVKFLPRDAVILGSETVCNSLGRNFARKCVAVTDHAGTRHCAARPFAISPRIHLRPYLSEHAPHYKSLKLATGHYCAPLDEPPAHPKHWLEGQTLSFLIDLLDENGDIGLRIYYCDSSPSAFSGIPDAATLAAKPVDVAILAVALFENQCGYPASHLAAMKPEHVLLSHWENFFRCADLPSEPLPGTNVQKFVDQMPAGKFTLPERHAVITVKY